MEKIYILGKDGQYEESSELDKAIKEQVKKEDERKRTTTRRDGSIQENEGEAEELASDGVLGSGDN
jgi:hypothetical protein